MRISSALKTTFGIIVFIVLAGFSVPAAQAQSAAEMQDETAATDADAGMAKGRASGLPLPRFVSLKSGKVNVRVGPDQSKYNVAWIYQRRGLPVEITAEYENWRRIRDADGDQGWVNGALLSGKRTAMTAPWKKEQFAMRKRPDNYAAIVAQVDSGVIGDVRECNGQWCALEIKGYRGWLKQDELWGVYPGEKFK